MSGLGPEWREVSYVEYRDDGVPPERTATVRVGDEDPHYFIRDAPAAIPKEPYTVIRAVWPNGGIDYLALHDERWWPLNGNHWRTPTRLDEEIIGFEVLAEPRAATAKVVLERVQQVGAMPWEALYAIARDFGVSE